jgi:hypothetical protein
VACAKKNLTPYKGDGIDVAIRIGLSKWTYDVALVDHDGNFVVAECKRWTSKMKQSYIASFAKTVELLRKKTKRNVAGLFFVKADYQNGAVEAATDLGIRLVACSDEQQLGTLTLEYHMYDRKRKGRIKRAKAGKALIDAHLPLGGALEPIFTAKTH